MNSVCVYVCVLCGLLMMGKSVRHKSGSCNTTHSYGLKEIWRTGTNIMSLRCQVVIYDFMVVWKHIWTLCINIKMKNKNNKPDF